MCMCMAWHLAALRASRSRPPPPPPLFISTVFYFSQNTVSKTRRVPTSYMHMPPAHAQHMQHVHQCMCMSMSLTLSPCMCFCLLACTCTCTCTCMRACACVPHDYPRCVLTRERRIGPQLAITTVAPCKPQHPRLGSRWDPGLEPLEILANHSVAVARLHVSR